MKTEKRKVIRMYGDRNYGIILEIKKLLTELKIPENVKVCMNCLYNKYWGLG